MKIILTESVENLGGPGDLVSVRAGFARNYLLPKGKALRATAENEAFFEARRAVYEERNQAKRKEADARAKALHGLTLVLLRQAAASGHLYGSVTARDVAEELTQNGHEVARSEVSLERAIKQTGLYPVRLRLHAEVAADVTLNIAVNQAEAEKRAKQARDGTATEDDNAEAKRQATEPLGENAQVAKDEHDDRHEWERNAEGQNLENQNDSSKEQPESP